MRVRVIHGIDDLASDMAAIPAKASKDMRAAVKRNAQEGNRIARGFASEQHTMNSSIDVPYQESFSAESNGPLAWVYGPVDDGIAHGGQQARGYEHGSRNQPPHLDLARSADIIGPKFGHDVSELPDGWFW